MTVPHFNKKVKFLIEKQVACQHLPMYSSLSFPNSDGQGAVCTPIMAAHHDIARLFVSRGINVKTQTRITYPLLFQRIGYHILPIDCGRLHIIGLQKCEVFIRIITKVRCVSCVIRTGQTCRYRVVFVIRKPRETETESFRCRGIIRSIVRRIRSLRQLDLIGFNHLKRDAISIGI